MAFYFMYVSVYKPIEMKNNLVKKKSFLKYLHIKNDVELDYQFILDKKGMFKTRS